MMIGNLENIEVKFKVRLLNIQTCNLKINHHHCPNHSIWKTLVSMTLDKLKMRKTNSTRTGWRFIIKWIRNIKHNWDKLMNKLPKECAFIKLNTKRNLKFWPLTTKKNSDLKKWGNAPFNQISEMDKGLEVEFNRCSSNVEGLEVELEDRFLDRNLENLFENKKNLLEESKCGSMNKMTRKWWKLKIYAKLDKWMIKVEKLIETQDNTASRFWREITTPKTKDGKTEIRMSSSLNYNLMQRN